MGCAFSALRSKFKLSSKKPGELNTILTYHTMVSYPNSAHALYTVYSTVHVYTLHFRVSCGLTPLPAPPRLLYFSLQNESKWGHIED